MTTSLDWRNTSLHALERHAVALARTLAAWVPGAFLPAARSRMIRPSNGLFLKMHLSDIPESPPMV